MTTLRNAAALLLAVAVGSPVLGAEERRGTREWNAETIDLASRIPIQDGGRVKPLSTFARFRLLAMNGRATCRNLEGGKLSAMEWLLDTLFFPEVAERYPVFLVRTSEVLDAIRLPHEGKRRSDRYTYAELRPGRERLRRLAARYSEIEAKDQSPVEEQIVHLARNLSLYEGILFALDFARHPFSVKGSPGLAAMFPGPDDGRLSAILVRAGALARAVDLLERQKGQMEEERHSAEAGALSRLYGEIQHAVAPSGALAIFPPADPAKEEWRAPADLLAPAFLEGEDLRREAGLLAALEEMVRGRDDPGLFQRRLASLKAGVEEIAEARGEHGGIDLEVLYYRAALFDWSLGLFALGFVLLAISWLRPGDRILPRAVPATLVAALVPLVAGITIRCVIRGRPPVTTLYETILFTAATGVITALAIELMNRRRIALALAAVIGTAGLFLAARYEVKDGRDTMPSLVAVLDTNFWLATHVTTVTLGYAAGLLAAALAHVFVLGKLFGLRRGDAAFYRNVTRMVYGVICFGLFFSILGTILGGIWANDSWGRFWGWDPKENGALMIVLW